MGISGARTVTSVGQWSNSTDHSVLNFGGLYNDQNIGEFGFNFKIVECTADSQCTPGSGTANSDANSNTSKCNLGVTSNFPQNACIDSVPPNVSINESLANPAPASAAGKYWFKGGSYTIPVNVDDGAAPTASGIDLNSCWYRIIDSVAGRDTHTVFRTNCTSPIPLKVGPASDPTNNCVTQDDQNTSINPSSCEVISGATDKAGNIYFYDHTKNDKYLHIDYTPPTAQ